MFLKEIRLHQFKCFEAFELSFEPTDESSFPVRKNTFLVGQNGNGKTALLQAIALITAHSDTLHQLPFNPDECIQSRKRSCTIEAVCSTDSGMNCTHTLQMQAGQSQADFLKKNANSLKAFKKENGDKNQEAFIAAYGSSRIVQDEPVAGARGRSGISSINSLFGKPDSLHALDFIAGEFQKKGGSAGVKKLCQLLNKFLPPELHCKGYSTRNSGLQFQAPDTLLSQGKLANGWLQMLCWLADLAYQIAHHFGFNKELFSASGLLLIDEPDLHLHPMWQRKLPVLLQQHLPNMQIIASTHSPLYAQQASRNELYALQRDESNKVNLLPFVGEPFRLLPHQLLMSPMFGLETDESWNVEMAKASLRQAAEKPLKGTRKKDAALTAMQPEAVLQEAVQTTINVRNNSSTEPEDLSLLRQIHEALQQDLPKNPKKH
ncbi:MAG: AAA family ATPase [Bacteroidetes bacterium]|nr:AAA family ATPase [Bacteroidota bacterium]MBS1630899.1 AAA family ATPase [Bacteroidota bacterium]